MKKLKRGTKITLSSITLVILIIIIYYLIIGDWTKAIYSASIEICSIIIGIVIDKTIGYKEEKLKTNQFYETIYRNKEARVNKIYISKLHHDIGDSNFLKYLLILKTLRKNLKKDLRNERIKIKNIIQKVSNIKFPQTKPDKITDITPYNSWTEVILVSEDFFTKYINHYKELTKKIQIILKNLNDLDEIHKIRLEIFNIVNYSNFFRVTQHFFDNNHPFFIGTISSRYDSVIKSWIENIKCQNISLIGGPGVGKTHISFNLYETLIHMKTPSIFLFGSDFKKESPLSTQILEQIDCSNYSWDEFLTIVNKKAKKKKVKFSIIIDGVNESLINGRFPSIWKNNLPELINNLKNFKNIVLITTYRPNYRDMIYDKTQNLEEEIIEIHGFRENDIRKLVEKFFSHYQIKVSQITEYCYRIFLWPLILKIYCEMNQGRTLGNLTNINIVDLYQEYFKIINKKITDRLNLHATSPIFYDNINIVNQYLWENNATEIKADKFHQIIQKTKYTISDGSLSEILVDNILFQYVIEEEEYVKYPFDQLAGFSIGKWIIENNLIDLRTFACSKDIQEKLFLPNTLHPLALDIKMFISLILWNNHSTSPFKFDIFIQNPLIPMEMAFYIDTEFLNQKEIHDIFKLNLNILIEKKGMLEVYKLFLIQIRDIAHPLHLKFYVDFIIGMEMVDRDLRWSEMIRLNYNFFLNEVKSFIKNVENTKNVEILHEKVKIIALLCTTTIRNYRNRVTFALLKYGLKFPEKYHELMQNACNWNDPYISERILAAYYGIVMTKHSILNNEQFISLFSNKSRWIFENFFSSSSPYSTTHFLVRQYARFIIEVSILHQSDLLTPTEHQMIEPPYSQGGIRIWGEKERHDVWGGSYDPHGPMPINDLNFGTYTIGYLVPGHGAHQTEPEFLLTMRNMYWRLSELGYHSDLFGEIDSIIDRRQYRTYNDEIGKIDRYGKKYSWIAYYELAGYRIDNNNVDENIDKFRISEYKIDPSFPILPVKSDDLKKVNFLKGINRDVWKWILKRISYLPFIKLSKRKEIQNENGPWILIGAFPLQKNKKLKRELSARIIGGIFIKSDENDTVEHINHELRDFRGYFEWVPLNNIFAGEIPWITDIEELDERVSAKFSDKIETITSSYSFNENENSFEIENVFIPSIDFLKCLNLKKHGRFFEFLSKNGEKISITVHVDKFESSFCYIHIDALKKYLRMKNAIFFQYIWGERKLHWQEYIEKRFRQHGTDQNKTYSRFDFLNIFDANSESFKQFNLN